MVRITGGFRVQFREQIKKFCSENDIQIIYCRCLGYCDNYTISGETYNIDKLMMYVEQLEKEEKKFLVEVVELNYITYNDGIQTS